MPGGTWATPEQVDWLKSQRVTFSQAQKARKLPAFWVDINREFFMRWPDQASEVLPGGTEANSTKKRRKTLILPPPENAPTPEAWVAQRKQQIYTWLNNHGIDKGDRRSGKVETIQITLPQSASRLSTELSIYSKKYYETRVKDMVDAELKKEGVGLNRIALINKCTADVYNNESEEIKQEIRTLREVERQEKDALAKVEKSIVDANGEQGPETYLLAQSTLPEVIKNFCDAMSARTGWSFSVLAGGPNPADNGRIRTIGIHTGVDGYGHSFGKAVPNFGETYIRPYSTFLHNVYPENIRKTYILNPQFKPITPIESTSISIATEQPTASTSQTLTAPAHLPHPTPEKEPVTTSLLHPTPEKVMVLPGSTELVSHFGDSLMSFPISGMQSNLPVFGNGLDPYQTTDGLFPLWDGSASGAGIGNQLTYATPVDSQSYVGNMSGIAYTEDNGLNLLQDLMGPVFNSAAFLDMRGSSGEIGDNEASNNFPGLGTVALAVPMPFTIGDVNDPEQMTNGEVTGIGNAAEVDVEAVGVNDELESVESVGQPKRSHRTVTEVTTEQLILGSRNRRPAGPKEVVPLTAKESSPALPAWLSGAQAYLDCDIKVKEWKDCLDAWICFEKEGLSEVTAHRLGTKGRPKILSKWIVGRKFHAIPEIENTEEYADQWLEWWKDLQPPWRKGAAQGSLPLPISVATADEDLSSLKKCGPSGLVTVLIGLKWWSNAQDRCGVLWLEAVKDVTNCLTEFKTSTNKRKGEGASTRGGKKRKL